MRSFPAIGVTAGGALNDRFGSDHVVAGSLRLLAAAFIVFAAATHLPPAAALVPALAAIALWGFSVWSFCPAQMARLIAAGAPSQASVALSLNTSVMHLGFSIGNAMGAGILDTGALWGIGLLAGGAEVVSLMLNNAKGR